jgi:glycosyltransferase involved in cell wall biosynthesis
MYIFVELMSLKNHGITLSIIIPCTDRTLGLKRAIESAFAQDYLGLIEVILVENNSVNRVAVEDVVDSLNSEEIKHFYLDNCCNANVARNYGASKASGEYIAFLDSDDEWDRTHLSNCLNLLGSNDCVFSAFFSVVDGAYTEVVGTFTGNITDDLFVTKSIDIRTSVLLFRKRCFDLVMFDEKLNKHQDWGLILDFSKKFTLAYSKLPTVNIYVDGNDRMSARTNVKASLYFAEHKLPDYARSSFLLSRMSDEITLGSRHGMEKYIKLFVLGFSDLRMKKKFIGSVFIVASKSAVIFFGMRAMLSFYKKYLVKNK